MRDERLYLDDIVYYARKAVRFTKGVREDQFLNDEVLQFAVTHAIQVIGEAAAKDSPQTREAFPSVPWDEIVKMRNLLVHSYFRVLPSRVWATVNTSIPQLLLCLGESIEGTSE